MNNGLEDRLPIPRVNTDVAIRVGFSNVLFSADFAKIDGSQEEEGRAKRGAQAKKPDQDDYFRAPEHRHLLFRLPNGAIFATS